MFFFTGFSQTYMDTIVQKSCTWLSNIPDSVNKEAMNLRMGLCLLNASVPYSEQFKRDYDIDVSYQMDNNEAAKLGVIIILKMADACPTSISKITSKSGIVKSNKTDSIKVKQIRCTINKIENNPFVVLIIKLSNGTPAKFYWLGNIDCSMDIKSNYKSLKNEEVFITFKEEELYDPEIKEYRRYNVIKGIEKVNK